MFTLKGKPSNGAMIALLIRIYYALLSNSKLLT